MGDIVNSVADVFGIGPASKQSAATKSAANTAAAASRYATDLQKQMFDKQIELQEPWRQAGIQGLNRLTAGLAQGGEFGTPFSQTNWQQDPGYQFRLSEGMNALNKQAAARGGLISGAALKAAQRYGQDMGSQEYQNAFKRYYDERQNMLNPLQSLAGLGQTSSGMMGQAAGAYGSNVGNLAMTNAANQGNLALAQGNIRASQYGTAGRGLDQALNYDWGGMMKGVNNALGNPATAFKYDTNIGSEQTNMLAAQDAAFW